MISDITTSIINNLHFYILILFSFIGYIIYYIGKPPHFTFQEKKSKYEIIMENIIYLPHIFFPFFIKINEKNKDEKNARFSLKLWYSMIIIYIVSYMKLSQNFNRIVFMTILFAFIFTYLILVIGTFKRIIHKQQKYNIKTKTKTYKNIFILNDKDNKLYVKNEKEEIFFIEKNNIKLIKVYTDKKKIKKSKTK